MHCVKQARILHPDVRSTNIKIQTHLKVSVICYATKLLNSLLLSRYKYGIRVSTNSNCNTSNDHVAVLLVTKVCPFFDAFQLINIFMRKVSLMFQHCYCLSQRLLNNYYGLILKFSRHYIKHCF